jgi:hypothetical protein
MRVSSFRGKSRNIDNDNLIHKVSFVSIIRSFWHCSAKDLQKNFEVVQNLLNEKCNAIW